MINEIKNLKELIASKDPINIELAFSIISGYHKDVQMEIFYYFLDKMGRSGGDLHYLDLNNRGLLSLPESIGELKNLRGLLASNNNLKKIPEFIGKLDSLGRLDLNRNQIDSIPEVVCGMNNLKYLYLNGNNLKELPESIGNMTSLKTLKIGYNQIRRFPESIVNLTSLENITIYGNPLAYGELDKLAELPSIRNIY